VPQRFFLVDDWLRLLSLRIRRVPKENSEEFTIFLRKHLYFVIETDFEQIKKEGS